MSVILNALHICQLCCNCVDAVIGGTNKTHIKYSNLSIKHNLEKMVVYLPVTIIPKPRGRIDDIICHTSLFIDFP